MRLRTLLVLMVLVLFSANLWAQVKGFDPATVQNVSRVQSTPNCCPNNLNPSPLQDDWATNAPIPIANGLSQTTTAASEDGMVYSFGGGLGAGPDVTINQTWMYDPGTDTWTQKANLPTPLRAFGAAVTWNGKVYIFGGFDGAAPVNALRIYDIAGDSYSAGAPMPSASFGAAVGVVNGRIFVAGGSGVPTALLEYDPVANNYTPRAAMPRGLVRTHGAGVDALNEFHVFGNGFDGRDHLIYNVETNTWRAGVDMPFGVTDPAVVAVGTDIYVMGGIGGPARTQIFDAAASTWTQGPNMPGPTNNTSGALAGQSIYVIGGFNGSGSIPTNYSLLLGGGFLAGGVTSSETGDPISGARVEAVGSVTRSTATGPDGTYRLRLPGDTYDVTASAFGFAPSTATGVVVVDNETTAQDFTLDPAPSFIVWGTVTSALDGSPLANAEVRILGTPIPPARTDTDGYFWFEAVPAGTYNFQASSGRCLAADTQEVIVDGDVGVDFALDRRSDSFGYTCDDRVAFSWVAGTTLTPLIGDDETMPLPLPFGFSFYGTTYNNMHISTNGFGDFTVPRSDFSNVCLPSAAAPLGMVAPLWTDLLVNRPAGVYTKLEGNAPNRRFIIEWRDVTFFGGPGVATFEIILEESTGAITYQYNRADGLGDARSATLGIQNQTGTVAMQYSCREAVVAVGKAVRIYRPAP